jgi:hypothetical protein
MNSFLAIKSTSNGHGPKTNPSKVKVTFCQSILVPNVPEAYTVILVRPKTGESAQLSFAQKFVGEFSSIWANFVQVPAKYLLIRGKFAQIGQILHEHFWGEI